MSNHLILFGTLAMIHNYIQCQQQPSNFHLVEVSSRLSWYGQNIYWKQQQNIH